MRKVKKAPVKDYSKVALRVIESLRLRATLFGLDAELNTMAEESDPSHSKHKSYLDLRRKMSELHDRRSLIDEELFDKYGIDIL